MDNVVAASEMAGKVERDFFGGSIRLHILHHAASGEVFGLGLIDELQHHGYRLSPGTLYPILHALERGGYLRSALKQVAGKRRRIYVATRAGKAALSASRQKVLALFHEILGEQDGRQQPHRAKHPLSAVNHMQAATTRPTNNPKPGK